MKFYADAMLGKLCKWLRIFGFDTLYNSDNNYENIRSVCNESERFFLSRSKKIIEKINCRDSLLIQSENVWGQVKQIISTLHLEIPEKILTRCLECNEAVIEIEKEDIKDKIPSKSFESFNEFYKCPKCEKIFWKGTHYDNTLKKIQNLFTD